MSEGRTPRLQHRLEYGLLRAMEAGLGLAGADSADRVGAVLGGLVRRPLGIRVAVVLDNLRRAFPEADTAWIEETAAATYRHLGREAAAMIRLSRLDAAAIRDLVVIPGDSERELRDGLAEGRGAIYTTGHYGNWEMAAAAVAARGWHIYAIVKDLANPLIDRRLTQARRALGIETMSMGDAPRRVPRSLAAGRTIGIVADQDARRTGVFIPFFGVPASTHRGPALFALRSGAPLFTAVARRLPDGRYLLKSERVDTSRSGSLESDALRITTAIAAHLESEIRQDPAQYFWFHKRWKTRPPEEPTPAVTGTTHR